MELTCKLKFDENAGQFELHLPETEKGDLLFAALNEFLSEVQPGFGQRTVESAWAKLAHWPEVDDQNEGMKLTLFFK